MIKIINIWFLNNPFIQIRGTSKISYLFTIITIVLFYLKENIMYNCCKKNYMYCRYTIAILNFINLLWVPFLCFQTKQMCLFSTKYLQLGRESEGHTFYRKIETEKVIDIQIEGDRVLQICRQIDSQIDTENSQIHRQIHN